MNLWIEETHLFHEPSAESLKENEHLDEHQRVYSAVVADGDNGVGKVLGALKDLGLEANTLVVFSSDNGPENTGRAGGPEAGNEEEPGARAGFGHFYSVGTTGGGRGRKRSLYEGGIRLPFTGRVPAGTINKTTVLSAVDFLPTLCAAAGFTLPADYKPDGENMLPALLGRGHQRTKPLFWDWNGKDTPRECWPRWAIRSGDWKLVTDDARRIELYRAPDVWEEARNVAKEHLEVVAKLSAELQAWKASHPKEPAADSISKDVRGKQRTRGAAKKTAKKK